MSYAYNYRGPVRPRFLDRITFVGMKLSLELSVAAVLYFVTLDMQTGGGGNLVEKMVEAIALVTVTAVIFGYAPLCLLLAMLWSMMPRGWRTAFPRVLTNLSLVYLAVGALVAGPSLPVNIALLGMVAANLAAMAIASQLYEPQD